MSKWINGDLFDKFQEQKKNEKDKPAGGGGLRRSELAWKNPDKGTVDKAKVYVGRFLPDPKGQFYKKYHYHMFKIGDQWSFFLCPKTFHFDNYCPWCSVSSKLYTGTKADKAMAYDFKRKEKFVGNWFVVDDPRDAEAESEEDKVTETVRAYEFPGKIEKKVKEQVTDVKNGLGPLIFDPGKDGFDFFLKVTSTIKDKRGKVWPDYGLSEFGRKPHAIADSDKKIEEVMKTTIDLDEYLEGMERDEEDVIESLKSLMLWDLVSSEWKKAKGMEKEIAQDDIPDFKNEEGPNKEDEPVVEKGEEDPPPFEPDNEEEDQSNEELLKELDNL